jgi:uncharacterized protein (DUF849 family)
LNLQWEPLIIAVAPNGAYKTKDDHPALPMGPGEIARTAAACLEAGAAMIHLHVRDASGAHSLDADCYRRAIEAIRAQVGDRIVIQATTEAGGRYMPREQLALVRALRPESVSLALRELVPDQESESEAAAFFAWLVTENILPQFIVYSARELERFQTLRRRGVIPPRAFPVLFVLGRYTPDQTSEPTALLPFLNVLDTDHPWMVCAFGAREHACAAAAAALGGHARVGFENNLYLRDGRVAPDNVALVAQVRAVAEVLARPLADADALRERWAQ